MAITRGDRREAVRASFEYDSNEVAFDPEFERQPGSEGPQIGPEYQAEIPELIITPADTFGNPKIKPRVGDKYQAQLPQLVPRAAADYNPDFLHGLPMPIIPTMLTCQGGSRTSLVPGLDDQNWNEDVKKCFLLGLYVHERDFLRVRRFVETKRMGAILSQYYGKFYSTSEFLRWNYNRKIMSSKGVFCWRVFSGSKQQILLSRMLRKVSEECQRDLSEVSERFKGGRMSVVDYVASLKAIAGIDILVESVGLGEGGGQDLTRVSPQPLTLEVKTKLLSGGFRIGKARSSDLFWNTVWPLLVARGWRPEVGKQFGRECLFFIMPGAKTYPRRKAEKGDKCFDSITDVLSRVRNESGLFGPGSDYDVRVGDGELYLQPIGGNNVVKTTTVPVDTSLLDASAQEVRTLPLEENIDQELQSSSIPPTEDIRLEYSNASAQQVRTTSLEKNVDEELPSSSMPPTEDILLDSSNAREILTIPEHSSFQERSTGNIPRVLIDLNLPYSESLDVVVVVEEQDDNTPQQSEDHRRSKAPGERRYSTRTRPPTSRLIEAAAHGYSLESRRRRRNEASSDDNQSTPSPRRPRVVAETASVSTTGRDNDNDNDNGNGNGNGNGNMPINPQVQFPPGPNQGSEYSKQ